MKSKKEILMFLQNEPLMEWKLSAETLNWDSITNNERISLFFGVGLCTAKEPGVAVPFDILQFFLVAERLRRFFTLEKIIILVADQHALTNEFMTKDMVDGLAGHVRNTLERLMRNLNLSHFELLLASEVQRQLSFQKILSSLPPLPNEYLRQEIADVIWLQENRQIRIKLGWTIDGTASVNGHDERFFDREMQKFLPSPISFLFTKAGMTLDAQRPKASPYVSVASEKRLLLEQNENVAAKLAVASADLSPSQLGAVRRHLANIVHTFEKLFGTISAPTLESKLQHIVTRTTLDG